MDSDEYVYNIVQDVKTRRVITIEDNRARLEMEYHEAKKEMKPEKNFLTSMLGAN